MAYPKLKQIITLKKQERVQMVQRQQAASLMKLTCGGPRNHTHNMQVHALDGEDAGLLFHISCINEELSMNMWTVQFEAYDPPTHYTLQIMESELNAAHKRINPDTMYGIFPDWGESQLDKWAIKCNTSYTFVFSLYYDIGEMNTRQMINVYGKPNIDLPTYIDCYTEAQTMDKLETNL